MSKTSKSKSKDSRAKEKRAQKESRRALYRSYRDQGSNSKSKRFTLKSQRSKKVGKVTHSEGPCGNQGCMLCFPLIFDGFLEKGKPKQMPQWIYNRWLVKQAA